VIAIVIIIIIIIIIIVIITATIIIITIIIIIIIATITIIIIIIIIIRLSQLDGFRFFTLLKRVEAYGVKYDSDDGNYVSFTIWEEKANFDSWRTGEAFKEA